MAQLKDTVVQGSLRIIDTTYTTDLVVSGSKTARYALIAPTSDGAPTWRALTNADVGLSNVENTKLSTWAGTSNITTLGTVTTGTWNATAINPNKGGTGITSYTKGDILYAGSTIAATATTALSKLAIGTAGYTLQATANGPAWTQTVAVANGGTGVTSFTANSLIMSGNTTTAALTTRAITNNTNNTAITNNNTNIPTMNTIYYGLVTVNNASQTRATGIYAPTSAGTANQILISAGGTSAPNWSAAATLASATSTTNTAAYTDLILGNNADVNSNTAHSEGRIKLYSAATHAHILQGASTTTDYTHILPNIAGWVATGGDGSTTGVGSTSAPIFLSTSGILTETGIIDIAHGGTGVSGAADHFVLIGKTVNSTSTLEWRKLLGSDLLGAIKYGGDMPTGNDVVTGTIWMRPTTFSIDELRCYIAQFSNISNTTFYDANIKQQMVVVNYMLSNPAAIAGDLIWNTGDGSITFSGTFVGTTDITLYLVPERGA